MSLINCPECRQAISTQAESCPNCGYILPKIEPAIIKNNIEHSNGGLITFPGGIPIKNAAGDVIGAIGVSGSSVENDHAVAEAGVAAL